MSKADVEKSADQGISKVKLAIGAASLFLFIIGVKRTFQMEPSETSMEPAKAHPAKPEKKGRRSDAKK